MRNATISKFRLQPGGGLTYIDTTKDQFYDVVAKLRFRLNHRWDVAVGYRKVSDNLQLQDLKNEFEREGGLIDLGYSF